ncbi:thiamine phosphate synthase [Phenylobacterium sp. LjRoot219]|uniref:thiamine phosphate synthase n=1 Tax=Phenylobacterium sp. LjRoot219 TaxID=3342283 RepID=UPI003ED1541C
MGGFWTLRRTAGLLKRPTPDRKGPARRALPQLLVFTDPARTPDLDALAAVLPPGAALVFRAFGAADAETVARRLLKRVHARRGRLLIGADAALAARIGADGVHLPERAAGRARALKAARPAWLVTAAAHSPTAARAARAAGADAAVVSAVFPSRSPSAGAPLGPLRLAQLVRAAGLPVYALGGVNDATAGRLRDLPLAGLAAVEGFRAGER